MNKENKHLFLDFIIILSGIGLAVFFIKTGILENILSSTKELQFLSSFIAGIFFTSILTLAPATIALGQIASSYSILWTAFFGAMGAVVGDFIIFKFVRDSISEHIEAAVQNKTITAALKSLSKIKLFRWTAFFVGGLIIASPLPDELGISLLGFLKVKTKWFLYISFVFNFIGILVVGLVARSLI